MNHSKKEIAITLLMFPLLLIGIPMGFIYRAVQIGFFNGSKIAMDHGEKCYNENNHDP